MTSTVSITGSEKILSRAVYPKEIQEPGAGPCRRGGAVGGTGGRGCTAGGAGRGAAGPGGLGPAWAVGGTSLAYRLSEVQIRSARRALDAGRPCARVSGRQAE